MRVAKRLGPTIRLGPTGHSPIGFGAEVHNHEETLYLNKPIVHTELYFQFVPGSFQRRRESCGYFEVR